MTLLLNGVYSTEIFLYGEVCSIAHIRILTYSSLKSTTDYFTNQFNSHPPTRVVYGVQPLWNGIRANLGDDTEKILVTLGDTYEATNLTDSICPASYHRQSRSHGLGKVNVYGCARDSGDCSEKCRISPKHPTCPDRWRLEFSLRPQRLCRNR